MLQVESKKPIINRRGWHFTPETPLGHFGYRVDFDPTTMQDVPSEEPSPETLDLVTPPVDWRASSYDLLNGLDVRDHSDSLPAPLFEKLFKRG